MLQAMFVTRIKIATTIILVALTCSVVCLMGYAKASYKGPASKDATKTIESMFPDGLTYNFGKVLRGTQPYHVFRIANTTDVPLRILSVRRGG